MLKKKSLPQIFLLHNSLALFSLTGPPPQQKKISKVRQPQKAIFVPGDDRLSLTGKKNCPLCLVVDLSLCILGLVVFMNTLQTYAFNILVQTNSLTIIKYKIKNAIVFPSSFNGKPQKNLFLMDVHRRPLSSRWGGGFRP